MFADKGQQVAMGVATKNLSFALTAATKKQQREQREQHEEAQQGAKEMLIKTTTVTGDQKATGVQWNPISQEATIIYGHFIKLNSINIIIIRKLNY